MEYALIRRQSDAAPRMRPPGQDRRAQRALTRRYAISLIRLINVDGDTGFTR